MVAEDEANQDPSQMPQQNAFPIFLNSPTQNEKKKKKRSCLCADQQ
jgi:hypothetical protein